MSKKEYSFFVPKWATYNYRRMFQNNNMISEEYKLQKFGKNIAKYRKMKHLSQNQLAEMLDISREHLAKIETAKRGVSFNLLFKLCDTLGIKEQDLFDFQ